MPSGSDQLRKAQIPLILMIVLGVVRIIANFLDFPGVTFWTWNPLRLILQLIYNPSPWALFNADQVILSDKRWVLTDIPTQLYAVVAVLALTKALPIKQTTKVLGGLTILSIAISLVRAFQLNLDLEFFTFSERLQRNYIFMLTPWLPYGLLTAWVYFASQSTPTINPILMQTLQPNPTPQEGHQPVEPPYNQPPQGAQTGPQGFGDTRAAGGYSIYDKPQFRLQMFGAGDRLFTLMELRALADAKSLQPSTLVLQDGVGFAMPASTIPGVFSKKTWLVALLLALFVGTLGIDRFYLGHTGIGIAKLLTFGGCGVWALIDLVLIAMRKVKDSEGLQLS